MSNTKMHEDITEHVSYERGKNERKSRGQASGYDIGVEDGRKRAWDLVGEAADWYKSQIKRRQQTTSAPDDINMQARYEAALWIQQVIKKDSISWMYNDGIANEHEYAHQKGLTRGFDLGWSYKGRFDRQLVQDKMSEIKAELKLLDDKPKSIRYRSLQVKHDTLQEVLNDLKNHPNNRENITLNTW